MKYLELLGIHKRFRDHEALRGVWLSVEKGELLCLLGPSGCGKTTTLRIIAGFESADKGEVMLEGVNIAPVAPQKREIGVVFQSYALFPHLTVAGNVGFGLKMRGVPKPDIANAVAEALRIVQLTGVGDRLPRQLSGGQQQRVALARAIAIRPRLLLLDEPLSNLDAKLRDEMRAEIRRIQRSVGITAIFVTHDQQEALALGDRIVVMDQGCVIQVDTSAAVYERPAHPFVASFFGRSNLIDGEVIEAQADKIRCRTAGGRELTGTGKNFNIGDRIVAVVKFERTQLSAATSTDLVNMFSGQVINATYLGSHIEYDVDAGGIRFGAIRPNANGADRFDIGQTVSVMIAPEDCQILRRG